MNKDAKIYVAGHRGMVGGAVVNELKAQGFEQIIHRTSKELDLRNQQAVNTFMAEEKPDVVIIAAAKVGGILANDTYPYDFIYDNMIMECNLINAAHENDVNRVIFLGSSCIYPKFAPQPMKEDHLLTGELEPTNEWYAIAKIAGIKLCEALKKQHGRHYFSMMPTNLYGEGDNFDLKTSHVLPAMIRKFHEAKENNHATVPLWGSGSPYREFLHVRDLAKAIVFAMENDMPDTLYNVGYGEDLTIKELAELIQKITGHEGDIDWDSSKPDGTPRKLMDSNKLRSLGWKPEISLEEGIKSTYDWFLTNIDAIRKVQY